ncbi:MAG: HEAT repeat domain-containing protein [Actinomycetota bacterium]|nr:HEAT repeat domain-containing protein [Actinomycetota bacterium]
MSTTSRWGQTPRQSIDTACAMRGRDGVVTGCIDLLGGRDVDATLIRSLGGPRAARFLDAAPPQRYWLRVWGARGLLWAWDDRATPALISALDDEAWRVREMAAKVVARHLVGDALSRVAPLQEDPVPRVRAAAARAVARLARAGA